MKIEKIKNIKNKILKLKLIQTKIYDKKQYLNNIKIEDIEFRLKKILYIIYKYHISNKKILFIGNPLNLRNTLNCMERLVWIIRLMNTGQCGKWADSHWLKGCAIRVTGSGIFSF